MKLHLIVTACLLGLVSFSGCSDGKKDVSKERLKAMAGSGYEDKPVFPVKGVVNVNGSPAQGVNLFLYREGDTTNLYRECRTEQDGSYCWSTLASCDGVPAGSYLLAFTYIPNPKKNDKGVDLFKGKYRDPNKNKIELKVEEGVPQVDVNYDLTMK